MVFLVFGTIVGLGVGMYVGLVAVFMLVGSICGFVAGFVCGFNGFNMWFCCGFRIRIVVIFKIFCID